MVKEACLRCSKPVYPTDKVGPLKDAAFFHQGCFKCYICGTRLALKSYCNNRNDNGDREVYCTSHVPLAGPHDPNPHKPTVLAPKTVTNGQNGHTSPRQNGHPNNAGVDDINIKHAMRAQAIQKPYPKLHHAGAKYILVDHKHFT